MYHMNKAMLSATVDSVYTDIVRRPQEWRLRNDGGSTAPFIGFTFLSFGTGVAPSYSYIDTLQATKPGYVFRAMSGEDPSIDVLNFSIGRSNGTDLVTKLEDGSGNRTGFTLEPKEVNYPVSSSTPGSLMGTTIVEDAHGFGRKIAIGTGVCNWFWLTCMPLVLNTYEGGTDYPDYWCHYAPATSFSVVGTVGTLGSGADLEMWDTSFITGVTETPTYKLNIELDQFL